MDDKLVRHRRVNEDGDWEYECVKCLDWKPKSKFKGCVDKVDGFGNCHICRNCISVIANQTKRDINKQDVDRVMKLLGYEVNNPDNPVRVQFHKKYNLPY